MFVEVKVVGQPGESAERQVPGTFGDTPLRAVLIDLVASEVAAYTERRTELRLLRVLTDLEIADASQTGKVRSGGQTTPAAPPVDEAVGRAIEAFSDGVVFVFLDG